MARSIVARTLLIFLYLNISYTLDWIPLYPRRVYKDKPSCYSHFIYRLTGRSTKAFIRWLLSAHGYTHFRYPHPTLKQSFQEPTILLPSCNYSNVWMLTSKHLAKPVRKTWKNVSPSIDFDPGQKSRFASDASSNRHHPLVKQWFGIEPYNNNNIPPPTHFDSPTQQTDRFISPLHSNMSMINSDSK